MAPSDGHPLALELSDVTRRHDERTVLGPLDWQVGARERWAVLGPNGSGKTSLLRIAALWDHPSSGSVTVLGERLGATDVRTVRRTVGFTSAAMADQLRPSLRAEDVVVTGLTGALEPWWHDYDDADRRRARRALAGVGCATLAERTMGTLSSGERQRVLLARSLVRDPALVILDEPAAGLDLGGREELVAGLDRLASEQPTTAIILVSHHVEELPSCITHVLLLRAGQVQACGPAEDVLASGPVSATFGVSVTVDRHGGRWSARISS
ncbi:MAG: ATP-binding cassette domain-containing protein [Acidimicrobiia bacterium]|nr:ATP-binding cassette domain-containing protein [Acidimicrobiia bacterium]